MDQKCGNCMMWAGSLNIGTCQFPASPQFEKDRWFTDIAPIECQILSNKKPKPKG